MMLPTAMRILSRSGRKTRLTVMIFHRVVRDPDPLLPAEPTRSEFAMQMRWVKECFNVLPLGEAVVRLQAGSLPARPLAITFDDGYADNVTNALPVLQETELPATFFIATGYIDGGRMWNDTVIESLRRASNENIDLRALGLGTALVAAPSDKRQTIDLVLNSLKYLAQPERDAAVQRLADMIGQRLPADLMMTSSQIRALVSAGMTVGAHTVTHPILTRIEAASAWREIQASRDTLQTLTGQPVELFAYPNGRPQVDYTTEHVAMVRELGFKAAVSTAWGVADGESDVYEIPRFTPWDRTRWKYAVRLMQNLTRTRPAMA